MICTECERTDVKCCNTCVRDGDACEVWHHCGEDCKEYASKIMTNADRIRQMSDEELATIFCTHNWTLAQYSECLAWLRMNKDE